MGLSSPGFHRLQRTPSLNMQLPFTILWKTLSFKATNLCRCVRLAKESASGDRAKAQKGLLAAGRSQSLQKMLTFVTDTAPEMTAKVCFPLFQPDLNFLYFLACTNTLANSPLSLHNLYILVSGNHY